MKLGLTVLLYTPDRETGELMWLSLLEKGFDAYVNFEPDNLGPRQIASEVKRLRNGSYGPVPADMVAVVDIGGAYENDPAVLHSLGMALLNNLRVWGWGGVRQAARGWA